MLKEAYNIKKLIPICQHPLLEKNCTEKKNVRVKACLVNLIRNALEE